MTLVLLMTVSMIPLAPRRAIGEPIVVGRFNPGVDNPDFTLDASGALVSMNCGVEGRPSCKTADGFYPSLSQYPVVSLEVARPLPDVEGHASWNGGAYDDVVHGREWNSGPGLAASTLPADRLGLSTTTADGVCPAFGYVRVPYPYLGTNAGAPWGHGGNSGCRPVAGAQTDLGPEFTGPAINWLLSNYLGTGRPAADAPLGIDQALGIDATGADADVRVAAVVYAYHLLSPASVRAGATASRSTLPFGLTPSDFVAGPAMGNGVPATGEQIARIQTIGEFLAKQAMRSARWGPYESLLEWQGGVAPAAVGSTATLRAYVGGCGSAGPKGAVPCAATSAGASPQTPIPDGGLYGVGRAGATWNEDNGIGLVKVPTPTSTNGASIEPIRDPTCPSVPAGWTCDDGFASFTVTINKPGHDTLSFVSGQIPDWEPEMWASAIGQDAGFPNATNRTVSATLELELDQPVFVSIQKRSSDPTIAVTGAALQLHDADGGLIGSQTTDASGLIAFGPIDTSAHPVPFSVRETAAPKGLQRVPGDQPVGEAPYSYSADQRNPTTFTLTDSPVTAAVNVRKVLSDPTAQPPDMTGFSFSVTRVADHQHFDELNTQPDGTTPAVSVPAGTFDICETKMPAWAQAVADVVGCQQVVVDGSGADVAFVFTNPIVKPQAATQLSSPVAGLGDTVVESVWTRNWQATGRLVTVAAALYAHPHGEPPDTAVCDSKTQATPQVTMTLTAKDTEQVASLPPMTIPDTAPAGSDFYAAGTIVDQATGALVARLPCGDVNERVVIPTITTSAPAVVSPGDVAHDRYRVAGLPTDLDWSATGHFLLVSATTDDCDAVTSPVGSVDEPILSEGSGATNGGVQIPSAGMIFRFRESLSITASRADHPPGWTLSPPDTPASASVSYETKPELCAAEESSPAPSVVTQVEEMMLGSVAAQPSIDAAQVTGFGTASLDPAIWEVRLIVGVYRHDPAADPTTWTCTDADLVGTHGAIEVHGDGRYTTDGLLTYPHGVALSNQEQLIGARTRSDGTVETFTTMPSGCQQANETQWVAGVTTRATNPSPAAGTTNSDIGVVTGVPPGFAGTIELNVYRYVPGGSIQIADACQPAMLGATLSYPFTGPGEHVSPDYAISADEVAGVQYVHQETLLTTDGRILAAERCAISNEVSTITRPQPTGQLIKTA